MQYLGGKSRLAKWIVNHAEILSKDLPVWDPFCGGLSVAAEFARRGRTGVASDKHPALIALYRGVQEGWDPPESITEADYAAAKLLPDSDPLKAFVGFGCSFGGKYFGGVARNSAGDNYCARARSSVLRDISLCTAAGWAFECRDFNNYPVGTYTQLVYCDPPYANTTGYSTGMFNHSVFWERCAQWHRSGSAVLVSEYTAGAEAGLLAEKAHSLGVTGTTGTQKNARTERLFTFGLEAPLAAAAQ